MLRPDAVILLVLAGCTGQETAITAGEGRLREPPSALDFGAVDVGRSATLSLTLHNDGIGALTLGGALDGDVDLRLADVPSTIAPGDEADVTFEFRPTTEGAHQASFVLTTDDPDRPRVERSVLGTGVVPTLDVSPSALWFGDVAEGVIVARSTTLSATGSGDVTIDAIDLAAAAYSWTLPDGVALPYVLPAGHAVALTVRYTAPALPVSAELLVSSSDVQRPVTALRLEAGESSGAAPPTIDLVAPVWGQAFLDDEPVTAQIVTTDPDDAPADLTVLVYLDDALVTAASPAADGTLEVPLGPLPPGDHTLVARAIDPDGSLDEDRAELAVYAPDDVQITLSGGDSSYAYLSVDDDLAVYVDDALVYEDASEHQSTLAPIAVHAAIGSTLRLVATDANPCRKHLDAIILHFGTTRHARLLDEIGASSCSEDPDYDATYAGPWPNVFLDRTFTIALP